MEADEPSPPPLQSRTTAAFFGVVLVLAGLLAGLFASMPITVLIMGEDPNAIMVIIIGLLAPMSLVLLGAAWNVLAYAITGRRRAMLNRYTFTLFAVMLMLLLVWMLALAVTEGDWELAVGAVTTGAWLLALSWGYMRARARMDRQEAAHALDERTP